MKNLTLTTALFATICFSALSQNTPCEQQWIAVGEAQSKLFLSSSSSLYLKAWFKTTVDGTASELVPMELWRSDDRTVVVNPYMKMWADEKNHALYMTESNLMLLRNNEQQQASTMDQISVANKLDSCREFLTGMTCEIEGSICTITSTYDIKHPDNKELVSKVIMRYNKSNLMLQQIVIHSISHGMHLIHEVTIESIDTESVDIDLKGTVIERISSNGQLKEEFKHAQFRDLRSSAS